MFLLSLYFLSFFLSLPVFLFSFLFSYRISIRCPRPSLAFSFCLPRFLLHLLSQSIFFRPHSSSYLPAIAILIPSIVIITIIASVIDADIVVVIDDVTVVIGHVVESAHVEASRSIAAFSHFFYLPFSPALCFAVDYLWLGKIYIYTVPTSIECFVLSFTNNRTLRGRERFSA